MHVGHRGCPLADAPGRPLRLALARGWTWADGKADDPALDPNYEERAGTPSTQKKKAVWKRNVAVDEREHEDWEGLKEATQVAAVSATVM